MTLNIKETWLILVESSFLLALSMPILKAHLENTIGSTSSIYAFLYLIVLIGITHLVPFRKRKLEYISGLTIFMFYLLHLTLSGNIIAPSSALMLVICFGKPIWLYRRHSIITFTLITLALIISAFIQTQNIINLLASILIPGQNYVSSLIFAMTYLVFYVNFEKINRSTLGVGFGSAVLYAFRSRTSLIALLPIYLKLFTKFRRVNKIIVIVLCITILTTTKFLGSLIFKYADASFTNAFMATRGYVWLNTLEYIRSGFWSPLSYSTLDPNIRRNFIGATSSHNWLFENILVFGLLSIIPIFMTFLALLRNFIMFLPVFIFAMFEPSVFYVANIVSFIFLNYVICQRRICEWNN